MKSLYLKNNSLIFPALLILLVIWIIPFIFQILISFQSYNFNYPTTKGDFIGLENYYKSFNDYSFSNSLIITSQFTFITLVIETFLGLILAFILYELPKKFSELFITFLIIPIIIAPFVVGLIWTFQFNPVFGPLSYYSNNIGLLNNSSFLDAKNAFYSICFIDIWQNTPIMTLIFYSAISGIPKEVKDSILIHKISIRYKLFTIYIRYILPIFIIAIFLRVIGILKTFDTIQIITQGGPANLTETFSLYANRLSFKELDFGLGSAQGLLFNYFLLIFFLVILKKIKFYRI